MEQAPVTAWTTNAAPTTYRREHQQQHVTRLNHLNGPLKISRLFGLFPYCDGTLDKSPFWITIAWVNRAMECGYALYCVIATYANETNKGAKHTATYNLYSITLFGVIVICIVHTISQITHNSEWKRLAKFNVNNVQAKSANIWFYSGLSLAVTHFALDICKSDFENWALSIYIFRILLLHLAINVVVIVTHFCINIEILTEHLTIINKELINLGKTEKVIQLAKLKHLTHQENELIDLAECVNGMFSLQLLLLCTVSLVSFMSSSFSFIQEQNSINSAVYVTDAVYHFAKVFIIVYFSAKFSSKVDKFNTHLFILTKKFYNIDINGELQLHCIMNRNVTFTAGGCFDIGYNLIASMISTAITYLVFIVQMT